MKTKSINLHDSRATGNINHNFTVNPAIKNAVTYTAIFMAWFIFLSYGAASFSKGLWLKYILAFIFLITGVIHISLFPKWLPQYHKHILYPLVLSAVAGLSTWLVSYVLQVSEEWLSITAATAFILPCAVSASFNYYISIPAKEYKQWLIPPGAITEKRKSLLMNSISLKLRIKLHYLDTSEVYFSLTTPPLLSMGDTFRYFLQSNEQYNIELKDNNGNPYAWQFVVKKWFRTIPIDPNTCLQYNGVKANDTIIISRVKTVKHFPDINLT